MYGAFAAVFMTVAGWIFAELFFKNKPDSYYTFRDSEEQEKEEAVSIDDDTDLPGTLASLLPLVVPIVLILINTTCGMLLPEDSAVMKIISFVGDSNIALAIGAILAIVTLGKRLGGKVILDVMDKTLKDAGPIVFITSAGGALGQVLKVSGAGDSLAQGVIHTGLPFILIPFVISGLLKVVQGSGTPIAASLGLDPILIFLASGAGARLCCQVNDSYFWVYTNCMGFDMKTGLKTLSISNVVMSLGGLLATFICSLWL